MFSIQGLIEHEKEKKKNYQGVLHVRAVAEEQYSTWNHRFVGFFLSHRQKIRGRESYASISHV